METHENREAKDTSRTEAFSDGVFAFAITLLVLNLRDIPSTSGVSLAKGLIEEAPSFFALATSFITILVMWLNHHNMFAHIGRVDRRLMLRNGILLLFVVLTPFTTSIVASHMGSSDPWDWDARTAAALYSGNFMFIALCWNVLWRYCAKGRRLLRADVTDEEARTISRQYVVAPIGSVVALGVSLVSGLAGVTVVLAIAAFYAVTGSHGD
ncbi:MAG TPA: TMEM175 family protein [Thermoplasmata archaeon]|jgi:uncharacterized membrane protein|nr:TMEM175 family protein [Thermoplasmata archaeon]